jgi:hypothetical protein
MIGYEGMKVVFDPAKMQRKPRMKATVEKSSARSAWGRMVAVVCCGLGDGDEKFVQWDSTIKRYGIPSVMAERKRLPCDKYTFPEQTNGR